MARRRRRAGPPPTTGDATDDAASFNSEPSTTAPTQAAAPPPPSGVASAPDETPPQGVPSRRDRAITHTPRLPYPLQSKLHGSMGVEVSWAAAPPLPIGKGLTSPATSIPLRATPPRVTCPLCTEVVSRGVSLVDHMTSCPNNTRSCPACKGAVQASAVDEHFMTCPRNTWPCFSCSRPVQLSGYVSHCTSCDAVGPPAGCPTRMYHGTTPEAAASILSTRRFELSDKGLLGTGVYVSRDVRKARRYGPCVIECAVFKGKTVIIRERHHPLQKCWHRAKGFDSAWIPPDSYVLTQRVALEGDDPTAATGTRGQTGGDLEEHCVADPRRVFPLRVVM
jgi:hypothetical protein